jgi:hypothetical protein
MSSLPGLLGSLAALVGRRTGTLRYTGPKSGRPIELKVWAVPDGEQFLVAVSKHTAKTWWKAFRGGLPATLTWQGVEYAVAGRLLDPGVSAVTGELRAARAAYLSAIPVAKPQVSEQTPVVILERVGR